MLSRRDLLRAGSAVLGGLALGTGCATSPPKSVRGGARRFAPVEIERDRIIRRVVGLRPFRPSGFVLRAESLGDKLLVHNYGHGGCGVTLSWGTALLAAELVSESGRRGGAAVLGCGAVGLATARTLQRRGFDVTIYAKELPPGTTSAIAGASFYPAFHIEGARRTATWDAQFVRAAHVAHRAFQDLVGDDYGVAWRDQFLLSNHPPEDAWDIALVRDLFPDRRLVPDGGHPFPARYVTADHILLIEPPTYLRALVRDFELAGGKIVVRAFASPSDVSQLPQPIVVNCTGLGARELFGDTELTPIKGQLTVLLPQPEVDYAYIGNDIYMFPRRDGILLGGTHERGVETLDVNTEAEERVLAEHRRVSAAMKGTA